MISVLLVDDHAVLRSSLRLRLEQEDGIAPVGESGTAEQAIAGARVLKPDVVLIDLLLPGKSGYQAIPEILTASPESRIVVLSSQTGPTPVRQAISAGAHGYVSKRATDTEVIEAIRRVAAGQRYVDPDLGAQLVAADGPPALEPLSDRERDVLHLRRKWFEGFLEVVPQGSREHWRRAGTGVATAVGGYVAGNALISLIAGGVTTVILFATHVPYPVPLGLIVAVFDLIPLVGATLGTIVVAVVALTKGVPTTVIVVASMWVYQKIENHTLLPLVYHRTVKLSRLAIAVSVAAGAEIGGIVGALLGIPIAGALKVVSHELVAWRRGDTGSAHANELEKPKPEPESDSQAACAT